VAVVLAWARSAGYERVVLEVGATNSAAIRLSTRIGFVATGGTGTRPAPRIHNREQELALEL